MTKVESIVTFLKLSGLPENDQQEAISSLFHSLGGLPLAIAQAAAYVRQMKTPVHIYIERLQTSDQMQSKLLSMPLMKAQLYNENVPLAVMNTWEISFNQI